jgi:hypothetical protein
MLFSTTSNLYNGASAVVNATLGDFWPYIVFVIGIPLAFFIIEIIVGLVRKDTAVPSVLDEKL